jgi:hypothetical protein
VDIHFIWIAFVALALALALMLRSCVKRMKVLDTICKDLIYRCASMTNTMKVLEKNRDYWRAMALNGREVHPSDPNDDRVPT